MGVTDAGANGASHAEIGRGANARERGEPSDAGPSRSSIYEIISNDRRRRVLEVLREEDREVYLREMAERVAAWENDQPVAAVTTQDRRRVETALRQFHLPKMADVGFLHYDDRRKTVRLAVPTSTFVDYLDPHPAETGRSNAVTTALGVGAILVLAASHLLAGGVGDALLSGYLLVVAAVLLGSNVRSA